MASAQQRYQAALKAREAARWSRIGGDPTRSSTPVRKGSAYISPQGKMTVNRSPSPVQSGLQWNAQGGGVDQYGRITLPTLTVNGQNETYSTIDEYVNRMKQLSGQSGTVDPGTESYINNLSRYSGLSGQRLESTRDNMASNLLSQVDMSSIKVNTGDAELDAVANQLLDTIWSSYSSLLYGVDSLNYNDVASLEAEVERQFGPSISQMKNIAEQGYQNRLRLSKESLAQGQEGLQSQLTRGVSDYETFSGRTQEDLEQDLKVVGRNYQEAIRDVALGFAAQGRATSGQRVRQEEMLRELQAEEEARINRTGQRRLDDLLQEKQRLESDIDLAQRGLLTQQEGIELGLSQTLQENLRNLDDFRASALASIQGIRQGNAYNFLPDVISQNLEIPGLLGGDTTIGGSRNLPQANVKAPNFAGSTVTNQSSTSQRSPIQPVVTTNQASYEAARKKRDDDRNKRVGVPVAPVGTRSLPTPKVTRKQSSSKMPDWLL